MEWKLPACDTLTGLNDLGKRIISQRIRNRDGWTQTTRAEKLKRKCWLKWSQSQPEVMWVHCAWNIIKSNICRSLIISQKPHWDEEKEKVRDKDKHAGVWIHIDLENTLPTTERISASESQTHRLSRNLGKPAEARNLKVCIIKTAKTEQNHTTSSDFSVLHISKVFQLTNRMHKSLKKDDTQKLLYWNGTLKSVSTGKRSEVV